MDRRRPGCQGTNARGEPCGMTPLTGAGLCFAHDPARGRERAEARLKGGRNRRVALSPPTEAPSLRDVGAIQAQLERALGDTLRLENSNGRSRTLGYLCGYALRALEVGEIEARLEALEAMVSRGPRRAS